MRKSFNERITASMILIDNLSNLTDIVDLYDKFDKTKLAKDHPYKLTVQNKKSINKFPLIKEYDSLITKDMKNKASLYSPFFTCSKDFVLKSFEFNYNLRNLNDEYGILCEIVLPDNLNKYKDIDLTTITEKTEEDDVNILYTGKRGVYEEIGLDFFSSYGKKIFNMQYQNEYRKLHNLNIPFNFTLGSSNKKTECFIICADAQYLIDCHISNINEQENLYNLYEYYTSSVLY